MISAKQAREKNGHSEMFKFIEEEIVHAIDRGDNECYVHFIYPDSDLYDWEYKEIRELGYEIFWSRPCLWYEIKW